MNPRCFVAVLASLASLALVPGASRAQSAYPNVDHPLMIGPGDTVQLLNRIVVDRAPGQRGLRIDVHYSTHIPTSDADARGAQADRLAQVVGVDAWKMGARRLTIGICDTRACAETREPPRSWYIYERGVGGVWYRSRGS
jgi:hypothetical protein